MYSIVFRAEAVIDNPDINIGATDSCYLASQRSERARAVAPIGISPDASLELEVKCIKSVDILIKPWVDAFANALDR